MNPWDAYAQEVGPPSGEVSRQMEERLAGALQPQERRTTLRRVGVAVLAVAAAVLVWFAWVGTDSGPTSDEAVVTVSTGADPQRIPLPRDGWLKAGPDSELEVESSPARGAHVHLVRGDVTLDVRQGKGLQWVVRTGAYRVEALGTRFQVRARQGVPEVTVFEGIVRVVGPELPSGGLEITPTKKPKLVATAAAPSPNEPTVGPAKPEPKPEPTVGPADPEINPTKPQPHPKPRPSRKTPADALDQGDALAAAGRRAAALEAYDRACKRGPTSKACAVATYRKALVLHRMGKRKQAIAQVSKYLDRHPSGPLARQALSHRMKWRAAGGQGSAAEGDAKTYLRRWPGGPDAATATRIRDGIKE